MSEGARKDDELFVPIGGSWTLHEPRYDGLGVRLLPSKALTGDRCTGCRHWDVEHLFAWGPFHLCLEDGCSCGRRALRDLAWAALPWAPAVTALTYLGWHLWQWAGRGFVVVG